MKCNDTESIMKIQLVGLTVQVLVRLEKEVKKRLQACRGEWMKRTGVVYDKKFQIRFKEDLYGETSDAEWVGNSGEYEGTGEKVETEDEDVNILFGMDQNRQNQKRGSEVQIKVFEALKLLRKTNLWWLGHIARREESHLGKRLRKMKVMKWRRERQKII